MIFISLQRFIFNNKIQIYLFLGLFVQFFLYNYVLIDNVFITEKYFNYIYPQIAFFLQQFSALFSFSIGDLFYVLIGILIIVQLIQLICKKLPICFFLKRILWFLNIFYFLFQSLWGYNYHKLSFEKQFNLPQYEFTSSLVDSFLLYNIHKTNQLRSGIFSDMASFSASPESLIATQAQDYDNIESLLKLKNFPKTPIFNSFFSFYLAELGVGGYYNPFVGSAQVNSNQPIINQAFTSRHEIAHQYGFASEKEANYVAFLACMLSQDKKVRYTAYYKLTFALLNSYQPKDSIKRKKYLNMLSAGVLRDRKQERDYYLKHQGFVNEAFGTANDIFLKVQHSEGISSYGKFLQLAINQYIAEKRKESTYSIFFPKTILY